MKYDVEDGNEAVVVRVSPQQIFDSEMYAAMDFLNGISGRFPDAISLAAGRPPNALMPSDNILSMLLRSVDDDAASKSGDRKAARAESWARFGQYADTDGIIGRDLSKMLALMENVSEDDVSIQVTNGIQEALLIECAAAAAQQGAVIAFDPTYVGLCGAAAVAGIPLYAVPNGDRPINALETAIRTARREVAGPILIYAIADHDNPSARSFDLADRHGLVALAARHDATILEDTAYRLFSYDAPRLPSLFSLDPSGRTVYLASFSKTFMPGVRIGFSARRGMASSDRRNRKALTNIKSFVSVTSAPMAQAIVSGYLREIDHDLDKGNKDRVHWCRANRDALYETLRENLSSEFFFTAPAGGFFLVVELPFECNAEMLESAARTHGVTFMPMRFFSPTGQGRRSMRLSFSVGGVSDMVEGGRRLADFLANFPRSSMSQ